MGRSAVWSAVLWICVAACSVELGIRARLWFNDPHVWDDAGLFRYKPSYQVGDAPALSTNNVGFFGDDLTLPKAAGARRVFLMGDSALTNPEIPQALKSTLEERLPGRRFEVNAAGLPRYTSYHNRVLLERYLTRLEPDGIVVYLGLNDNVYNTNAKPDGEPPVGLWAWSDCSTVLALDMFWYHTVHKRFLTHPQFTVLRSPSIFETHIRTIIETAQHGNIAVLLVKPAVGFPTDDPVLEEAIRNSERPMRHFWGDLDPALRGVAAHTAVLEQLAADYRIPVVDAASVLPRTSRFFRDLCHFTSAGNVEFGRFLAEMLVSHKILSNGRPAGAPDAH